jgi:tRNA dimethylallyltransferase
MSEIKTALTNYYNFAVENIQGKITLECLKEKFSQSHRNYAKRQITWFKKETFFC